MIDVVRLHDGVRLLGDGIIGSLKGVRVYLRLCQWRYEMILGATLFVG